MSSRRYAVVGAGHRSQMYVDAITGPYADHAELVAICEPNPVRAAYAVARGRRRHCRRPRPGTRTSSKSMIRAENIDRVVITARATTSTRRSSSGRSMPAPTSSSRSP